MAKLSKDKRDRMVLVYLVAVFAMAATYILLVKSQQEKLKQLTVETQNLEEQIDGTRRLLAQREAFDEVHAKAKAELAIREDGMAHGDRFFWFVNMLNKFKAKYEVDIPQISPETVGPVGVFPEFPYQAATFKISGSGHYYDFGRFLRDFENQHPYIRVQNLDVEPDTSPNSEKVNFRMDVVTLIKPANT
jgi:Tfp pilus assembly protein PilO